MAQLNRKRTRQKVHRRIRKKISGTAGRPRLSVSFSNRHIQAQLIDDVAGVTLAAATSTQNGIEGRSANVATAAKIGELIAARAKEKKIDAIVFDRGGYIYHGKVKALADAAREAGLKF
ncbi:MAG: large subunit ribosomal protein L18 [Verrucomicrobiales bacterium]|jgi:large subunit ribosomal protein L18